jgi:hypothetical protein
MESEKGPVIARFSAAQPEKSKKQILRRIPVTRWDAAL